MGLNIDELYSEVLYEIIHMVGSDAEIFDKTEIFNYLKDAFKLEDEKHDELLQGAQEKEAPKILLNIEIMEAKDLKPKDPNGLSDPFCKLYLSSSPSTRFHTAVKNETLNPVWEEHFSLAVKSTTNDVLKLEVWDFDPAETIKEKVTKISGVKGVKGLGKLMKEIAVTASNGKHDSELIGTSQIVLKSIPSSGQTRWIQLEKKPKSSSQGNVKLKLAFGSHKNSHVACQEYRHLLRLVLLHELEISKIEPHEWSGVFSDTAAAILRQHSSQSGIGSVHESMARWVEFTRLHANHRLNFTVYSDLITAMSANIKDGMYSDDEMKLFWEGAKRLLPSIFTHIKQLKKLNPKDKINAEQTVAVIKVLSVLCSLKCDDGVFLFPEELYGWLSGKTEDHLTIQSVLTEAILQSSEEWLQQGMDSSQIEGDSTESKLKQAIKVSQVVRNDLQRAIEHYDKLFISALGIEYAKVCYIYYEGKLVDYVEPLVQEICSSLKTMRLRDGANEGDVDNEPISTGTSLFELYLMLQRLSLLGSGLLGENGQDLRINKFHNWFYHGVAKWLDIAVYKAIARIDKAIELDALTPVDSTVKYSSSAVDTLSIFYQIKVFWSQLNWPDVEGSYTFVAKILDDLCRCCVYYADQICKKVGDWNESPNGNSPNFHVTNEWCLVINNIDYVKHSIQPFANNLGVTSIIEKLSNFRNQSTADNCCHTIKLVIENTVDIVGNKIIDLLEIVSNKMIPTVKTMLLEGSEMTEDMCGHINKLMGYLDENLMTFHTQLNNQNFERVLSIVWSGVTRVLTQVAFEAIEKKKNPYFFKNLLMYLESLVNFFRDGDKSLNIEEVDKIKASISMHSKDTSELIDDYVMERVAEQKLMATAAFGMLTVKIGFFNNSLVIHVLNARNLPPHDSNGLCDPFVKIVLHPKESFRSVPHFKTKVQKKTLFPLFEETFIAELDSQRINSTTAVVHFLVKDQDYIFHQFVGEAFIPFSDIETTDNKELDNLDQIHLTLHKPTSESKIFQALTIRNGDKLAKDFIKKQKSKMGDK